MKTRILLADDHKILRDGLRALLEMETDFEVVAEASNGDMALEMVEKLSPDVVVMDIGMPGLNGIEATQKILEKNRKVKIMALSAHSDRRYVADMLRAGASGYLVKDCAGTELARGIRTIMAGKTFLCSSTAKVVAEHVAQSSKDDQSARSILTTREINVLQRLAEGKTTKEIAFELAISVKTVETHRANIFEKLGLSSVAELTKYALREGITSLEF